MLSQSRVLLPASGYPAIRNKPTRQTLYPLTFFDVLYALQLPTFFSSQSKQILSPSILSDVGVLFILF